MQIFFLARHFTYFRNFESVLRLLAERGHQIHLAVEREETFGGRQMVEVLAAAYPGVTVGPAPQSELDEPEIFARRLRLGLDYLRYLDARYDDAPKLRARARERTPRLILRATGARGLRSRLARGTLARVLHGFERALPVDRGITSFLRENNPDVVLLTPLVELGSVQFDYLRCARSLGIRTGLCVWSWDHLSSKALIRESPDRVFVWNETQKQEAVELHGIAPERVVLTGAQCFDQWFDRRPARTREQFCARVGLPADRPLVLYVCSALFRGSPSEAELVTRWIGAVRASADARLRDAAILVRPHPSRMGQWRRTDLGGLGPVAVWGANPVDPEAKADYFESLYYSAAVVGLNTSAFLEAAIVGRPVFTILLPEFHDNQEGTLHFHYLLTVGGGLLRISRTFEEHVAQLGEGLAPAGGADERARQFVDAFIRPHGRGNAATPRFADAIERLATEPARAHAGSLVWRLVGRPVFGALGGFAIRRFESELLSEREATASATALAKLKRRNELRRAREIELARKQREKESRVQAEVARRAEKLREKAEALQRKERLREEQREQKRQKMAAWTRRKRAARLWRLRRAPWLALVRLRTRTQPWRKTMRYHVRRMGRHASKKFWVGLRHYAAARLKSPEAVGDAMGPSVNAAALAQVEGDARPTRVPFEDVIEAREARETVTLLGRSAEPIIVGPWLTETGFELLYWIPFVAWAKAYGGLDEERLIVVSRGGTAPWYRHISSRYQDILSFYTPDEFRMRNDQRAAGQPGSFKHREVSAFDREIVERVSASLSLGKTRLLHPLLMYNLFSVFWHQREPMTLVEAFTAHRTLGPFPAGDLASRLPSRYIAAKFYMNAALPESPANCAFISAVLTELTKTRDVVLLATGHRFDDHLDYSPEVGARLHTVEDLMTPERNLEVQTRIISGAEAFVGTYGGFSYLAPLCGVDTLALYSDPTGFRFDHLELANRVFARLRGGSFVALDVRDLDMVRRGVGAFGAGAAAAVGGGAGPPPGPREAARGAH